MYEAHSNEHNCPCVIVTTVDILQDDLPGIIMIYARDIGARYVGWDCDNRYVVDFRFGTEEVGPKAYTEQELRDTLTRAQRV